MVLTETRDLIEGYTLMVLAKISTREISTIKVPPSGKIETGMEEEYWFMELWRNKMPHSYKRLEGVTLQINLRKNKWLVFGGYNHTKSNISTFLSMIGPVLDTHMSRLEIFIILGDFNCEIIQGYLE